MPPGVADARLTGTRRARSLTPRSGTRPAICWRGADRFDASGGRAGRIGHDYLRRAGGGEGVPLTDHWLRGFAETQVIASGFDLRARRVPTVEDGLWPPLPAGGPRQWKRKRQLRRWLLFFHDLSHADLTSHLRECSNMTLERRRRQRGRIEHVSRSEGCVSDTTPYPCEPSDSLHIATGSITRLAMAAPSGSRLADDQRTGVEPVKNRVDA